MLEKIEQANRNLRRIKYVFDKSNLQGGFEYQIGAKRVYFRRPFTNPNLYTRLDPDIINHNDLVVMARVNENYIVDCLVIL